MTFAGVAVAGMGCAVTAVGLIGSLPPLAYFGVVLLLAGLLLTAGGILVAPADEDSRPPWLPEYEVDQEDDYRPPREKAPAGTLEVGQPRAPKIPPPGREP